MFKKESERLLFECKTAISLDDKNWLYDQLPHVEIVSITATTTAILDLSEIAEGPCAAVLRKGCEGVIVPQAPGDLLKQFTKNSLHGYQEKASVLRGLLPKTYRFPVFSSIGLFIPFGSPSTQETDWYNALLLTRVETFPRSNVYLNETVIGFGGVDQLILPRDRKRVRKKVKQSLDGAHLYYTLFQQVMDPEGMTLEILALLEQCFTRLKLQRYSAFSGEEMAKGFSLFCNPTNGEDEDEHF